MPKKSVLCENTELASRAVILYEMEQLILDLLAITSCLETSQCRENHEAQRGVDCLHGVPALPRRPLEPLLAAAGTCGVARLIARGRHQQSHWLLNPTYTDIDTYK